MNLSYKRGANDLDEQFHSVVSNDLFYIADGKELNDDLATTNEEFRIADTSSITAPTN